MMTLAEVAIGMKIQKPGQEYVCGQMRPYPVMLVTRIPAKANGTPRKMIETKIIGDGRLVYITIDQLEPYQQLS